MRTIKNHAILFVIGLTISTGAFSLSGNIAARKNHRKCGITDSLCSNQEHLLSRKGRFFPKSKSLPV